MGALKYVLYIISFLMPIIGIIIGIIFMISSEPEKKKVGKNCLILAIVSIVLVIVIYCIVIGMILGAAMMI